MTGEMVAAAWVPYRVRPYEEASALAAAWSTHMARQRGLRRLLVTPQVRERSANAFIEAYARGAEATTPRGKRMSAGGRAVLDFLPDWKQLDQSLLYARGGTLAVVEGHDPVLRGWAQAVGAINLLTKATTPDPAPDEVRASIARIHQSGYNGWRGSSAIIGERVTTAELTKLRDAGWSDQARIVGGVVALGGRTHNLDELAQLLDRVYGPAPSERPGMTFHTPEDSPRCPVDGVEMIDTGRSQPRWLCRSCGRVGELQAAE